LFSYRRYAADLNLCFYGRWLSPSVKELSPQSGLFSKALRSSKEFYQKIRFRKAAKQRLLSPKRFVSEKLRSNDCSPPKDSFQKKAALPQKIRFKKASD
jgi:hypothetical protein